MKTFFSILICVGVAFTMNAQNLIRVNANPTADADYTVLQTAIDNANAGDTIYVETEGGSVGSASVDKQLTFIGKGYYLNEQDSTYQSVSTHAIQVNFNATLPANPHGSKFIGLEITGMTDIRANNITFEKCKIDYIQLNYGGSNYYNSGLSVIQCSVASMTSSTLNLPVNNLFISNSILDDVDYIKCTSNCLFVNNQIGNNSGPNSSIIAVVESMIFENNIFLDAVPSNSSNPASNNQFHNNVFVNLPTNFTTNGIGNIAATSASLFVGGTGSDAQYQLSTTSPAKGAGLNGVDCGPFGGATPYVLSGLPDLPRVFKIITGFGPNVNQMNVNVKATTNN